jgi:hypothetical protein
MIRNDVVKEARKEASHHKKMQHYLSKNQNKNEILHSHVNDINQEIEINEQIMMIEKFLVGYPDIVKTIIRMKITGDSNFEIARKLRVNYTYINNTINRFITRFRKVNNS